MKKPTKQAPRPVHGGAAYSQQEIAQRRDEAIKRALRTPPTHLKDIPKKRPPKQGAPPSKRGDS